MLLLVIATGVPLTTWAGVSVAVTVLIVALLAQKAPLLPTARKTRRGLFVPRPVMIQAWEASGKSESPARSRPRRRRGKREAGRGTFMVSRLGAMGLPFQSPPPFHYGATRGAPVGQGLP